MPDFLLELRSEEIPARMQAGARADLEKLLRKELTAAGISTGAITVWSTPRRLALIARDLPVSTAAVSEELKGPRAGAPPQALEGFLRKTGLRADQLTERDGILYAVTQKPGRAASEVLAEAIPAIIRAFPWPKSQRWGAASLSSESLRWVRPLSGIVALFGGAVVPCEIAGIAAGRETIGHRFHSAWVISIADADDYAAKLRAAHVIVDHAERQDLIRTGAHKAAADAGLVLVEDEGLVIENAGLTEWPVPLLGRFDAKFLEVPPEVIQLTARTNQKYFVCEDAGKLANAFICTANIAASDGGAAIIDGNRKVLVARLADARFFWEQDRKQTLAQHAEGLARITFHEKLGTVADKVERVAKLARWLVEEGIVKSSPARGGGPALLVEGQVPTSAASDRPDTPPVPLHHPADGPPPRAGEECAALADQAELAARLCKADLVTAMVGEFPELQGIMGGYYARAEGLDRQVADAIRDHYKPVGQGDDVPTAPVTVAVSLADKLDTLVGFFAATHDGWKPSSSRDPFALRRAAIGCIRFLLVNNLRVRLTSLFDRAYVGHISQPHRNFSDDYGASAVPLIYPRKVQRLDGADIIGDAQFDEPGVLLAHDFTATDWRRYETAFVWEESPQGEVIEIFSEARDFFRSAESTANGSREFFADRLKVQQREAGVRHDLIDAVFALGGEDDLVRLLARVQALQAFIGTGDGTNLLAGYKRAANLLKKEGYASPLLVGEGPGVGVPPPASYSHSDKPLSYAPEPAEQALMDALSAAGPQAAAAVAAEHFAGAMAALATLRAPIDAFFETVTVNDPEPARRASRLALLAGFRDAVHGVADFSKIEG